MRQLTLPLLHHPANAGRAIGTTVQRHPINPYDLPVLTEPPFELIRLFGSSYSAKVDPELYEELRLIRWRARPMGWKSPKVYAVGSVGGVKVAMHRLVMQVTDPRVMVDHRYGDTLDNRRERLRIGTALDNNRNRPMPLKRGLRWVRLRQQWQVNLTVNGRRVLVGYFDTEADALEARRMAEVRHYGFQMREEHGAY